MTTRCPATHPDDTTRCSGPPAVVVLDQHNGGVTGCEHHAARILASLERARVYALPDAPDGAAGRVFKAAGQLLPFTWMRACGGRERAADLSALVVELQRGHVTHTSHNT